MVADGLLARGAPVEALRTLSAVRCRASQADRRRRLHDGLPAAAAGLEADATARENALSELAGNAARSSIGTWTRCWRPWQQTPRGAMPDRPAERSVRAAADQDGADDRESALPRR